MSATIISLQEVKVKAASDSLVAETDDFSVKIISKIDPLFWVRFQRTDNGEVIVTDFSAGGLPQYALNLALRKGLKELYASPPRSITFSNVNSSENLELALSGACDDALHAIRQACEGLAMISRRAIRSFQLVPDGHKLNVVVSLG
ncbi:MULTISPECIES: hypothetical protein [unclassified Lentilitoribacter]|jgi:hypothetical protein|uniref:hypothetical protein n=1 Tax=unclassified Lentilitoribacter TaxID=2647570 RepID=UPI0013A6BC8A|nr:hypothetical protein [Lentilitoribacter sp. Alg239-R112]